MKKLTLMMVLATLTLAAVSCGPKKQKQEEQPKPKMLVVYYSQTSNTQKVATEIATRLNADLQEIVPVEPYEGDFEATINRGKKELDEGIFPEIQPLSVKVTDYDIIFIGYPIWFGTYAPPIGTFLNHEDLSDKKIVPFCTFGSGGLESSMRDLYNAEPKATMLDGYGVRAARLDAMPKEIDQFLKAGKFIEGEYTQLPDFSEQQPVNEAETAIFEAATGDYPMMHAQPESVGSRVIPGGTEYLFVANDLPRKDMPDMPPMGPMKVYVTVIEGETPVFTRVIR